MKEIKHTCLIQEFDNISELEPIERQLLEAAANIRDKAYAPYSKFYVGAAVELEDGTVVLGSNQENVAYPSGLCAERTALFAAHANHPGKAVVRIAISASSGEFDTDEPVYPCGACRQVISEYERLAGGQIQIVMRGKKGKTHKVNGLINLLPVAFDADKLRRDK